MSLNKGKIKEQSSAKVTSPWSKDVIMDPAEYPIKESISKIFNRTW